ncbi:MAG: PTS lactose/cellobiose transporter subunit IIA [Enterobacteriaceae bacterium]
MTHSVETLITQLIVDAGEGKSLAFEALEAARAGDFSTSEQLLHRSGQAFLLAHKSHMALLHADLSQAELPSPILLMHAEDHMMSSMLAKELIVELIETQKQIHTLLKNKD